MIQPLTHLQYAQFIGAPRSVTCRIELGSGSPNSYVWNCLSHVYGFNERPHLLDGRLSDRCPMSRLEEWRAHAYLFTERALV